MHKHILEQIKDAPETVQFKDVIDYIDSHYLYTPVTFYNGETDVKVINEAGTNEGSCKIFAFALANKLTEQQTLHCFGHYYRDDVLKHPQATDHANIRQFMRTGWKGIKFTSIALLKKPNP